MNAWLFFIVSSICEALGDLSWGYFSAERLAFVTPRSEVCCSPRTAGAPLQSPGSVERGGVSDSASLPCEELKVSLQNAVLGFALASCSQLPVVDSVYCLFLIAF